MKPKRIFQGCRISIYTASKQANEFVSELTPAQARDLLSCARTIDRSLQLGRPSDRIAKIAGSSAGIFEMRVTARKRKGPHVRLLYVTEGRDWMVLTGVMKTQPRLARKAIELAEREAARRRRQRYDD